MIINKYDYLPKEAFQIRERVFQTEQGFEDEFDAIDDISVHLVLLDGDKAIATCRYYWCEEKNTHVVGRIAVVREYRGKEMGARILKEAEKCIWEDGGHNVYLAAQERASGFYKKQGYDAEGELFDDEGCPHIWMRKRLKGDPSHSASEGDKWIN